MGRLILSVLAALAPQPAGGTNGDAVAELTHLEAVWNQAHLAGDAAALDRIWADDLVVIVPGMPAFSKGDVLGVARSGRMKFQRYESTEVVYRVYEGWAVATGRIQRTRTISERVIEDDWRFTKVYRHLASGWQVVSFHASETGG